MEAPRLSLNALRAFEATARLRSFSAAADELAVTHGAVSRHVRDLEGRLGVPLLLRTAQGALPTAEGARLAEGLSTAFGLIQSSVEQVRPGPLTLACSESIMMYWLLPRLAGFQDANPDVELRFNMSHGPIDFMRDQVGVAIRLSSIEPPRDAVCRDVATEWVGPVCSADYLRDSRVRSAADLARTRLMVSKTRPAAWSDWLRSCERPAGGRAANGSPTIELPLATTFEHFYLLIQAAKCGLGMANVPRMLVENDLNNGTLVAPLGFVPGPNRLVLWTAPHLARRSGAERLCDWLAGELRGSALPSAGARAGGPLTAAGIGERR